MQGSMDNKPTTPKGMAITVISPNIKNVVISLASIDFLILTPSKIRTKVKTNINYQL